MPDVAATRLLTLEVKGAVRAEDGAPFGLGCLGCLWKQLTDIIWPRGLRPGPSQKQKTKVWEEFGKAGRRSTFEDSEASSRLLVKRQSLKTWKGGGLVRVPGKGHRGGRVASQR